MQHVETELKYLLDKDSFYSLYQYLKQKGIKPELTRQVNYYFSSSLSRLKTYSSSTRIRYVQGRWELTCKVLINETISDAVQNCYEYNAVISREKAMDYINHGLSKEEQVKLFGSMFQTHNLPQADMLCFGHLRTARFSFNVKENLPPLLLDCNRYLDLCDYELEWELKQVQIADELLQNMFNELGIKPVGSMKPKVKRFFDRLWDLKN
ncbi:MAG TPA: CYTH domain-containing protein [Clostridiales bacterium]|nr:CYTH domain-containing protein [Clostridiales bacterium]